MNDTCHKLLLSSLNEFYNNNTKYKYILKKIIEGDHKLSLRTIDWLVTHYSKNFNIVYWFNKITDEIYNEYPLNIIKNNNEKEDNIYIKVNLYQEYRAQLKSYTKYNFDSFRRHDRITFFLDKYNKIETTVGQLNFFRWIFKNRIIEYALLNYNNIYNNMIEYNNMNKTNKNLKKINNKKILISNDNIISNNYLVFD